MYSATFTFAKKQFDDAFQRLDQAIALAAQATPGYLGEESWENPGTGLVCTVYYWETLESLQQLMQHPAHLAAKARQTEWLDGYHVVVSQVLRMYGDARLAQVLLSPRLSASNGSTEPPPLTEKTP